MEQQNIQSTKITANLDLATSLDIIPSQEPPTNECGLRSHTNRSRSTKIIATEDPENVKLSALFGE
jgi:hypothetical protein